MGHWRGLSSQTSPPLVGAASIRPGNFASVMARCCLPKVVAPARYPCLRWRRRPSRPCMPKLMPRSWLCRSPSLWQHCPTVRCCCCLGWILVAATKQPLAGVWPCCTSRRWPPAQLVSAGTGMASSALGLNPVGGVMTGDRPSWSSGCARNSRSLMGCSRIQRTSIRCCCASPST